MSHLRFARVSLILATLGLNLAPALLGAGAHAQTKPSSAELAAAAAAATAKQETVRPEMYKLLNPAIFKDMLAAKQYPELTERINQADAMANKTPYESYVINRMRGSLGTASGNDQMMMQGSLAAIASGLLTPAEQSDFVLAMANKYYSSKDYPNAIIWFKRYQQEGGDASIVRPVLIRAYYFSNDFANAKTEMKLVLDATEKAGKAPDREDLLLYRSVSAKLKDKQAALAGLEKLVTYYPSDEYWLDLLASTQSKPSYKPRMDLDVLRLEAATVKTIPPESYIEFAELALLVGLETEANKAIEAGYAAGVLGTGPDAAKHKKIREQAAKGAADDQKNLAGGEAAAAKSKDGLALVNLGYALVTIDQFDKGLALMEKGIAKGGMKHPDDVKLHLGVAYVKAGRKEEAIKTFQTVQGADGQLDIAHCWIMYVNRPIVVAAAVPAPK